MFENVCSKTNYATAVETNLHQNCNEMICAAIGDSCMPHGCSFQLE